MTIIHPHTRAREIALQYLYMFDLLQGKDVQMLSDHLGECIPKPEGETVRFCRKLVETVQNHKEELDQEIVGSATNWKLSRMSVVDRNILRLGLAEMIGFPETPYKVALNESIELAKKFSSESACSFVNGVLDRLRVKHRPGEHGSPPDQELEVPGEAALDSFESTPVAPVI